MKKMILAAPMLALHMFAGGVGALEIDDNARTVASNDAGDTVTISMQAYLKGKKLFSYACASCHVQGRTATHPNVGLDLETLALAVPPRNTMQGLMDFLKAPRSFDGEDDISEEHPGVNSADIFPEMRNFTEDDLHAIAAYLLIQPKISKTWGGGYR